MERINDIILEVLAQLYRLNENVLFLSSKDGGIVIHDTFANVSTWVNLGITLLSTIIGAGIGGWITIQLFKKQERMRIKQELKLEFYKGYKLLYKKYIDEIIDLKNTVRSINVIAGAGKGLKLKVVDWGENTNLEYCDEKDILDKVVKLSKNSTTYFNIMNDYIEMNNINLTDYNGELFKILALKFFNINEAICNIEEWNKEIGFICNTRYTVEEIIEEYDRIVKCIIESYEEIDSIVNVSKDIHSKLECEFLNQYFKN